MINYLPFTYLPEALGARLTAVFGTLAVCRPLGRLVPDHMRREADKGNLLLRSPEEIDERRLEKAFQAFTTWADLHHGKIGDLTNFFRTDQWHGNRRHEAGANLIRTQIHRWDDGSPETADDPLFEAALFLSLAHIYDQQQDAVDRDLGSVRALEETFGHILEGGDAHKVSMGPDLPSMADGAMDRGLYMTERRIQSWARLADRLTGTDEVFVTTSRAVWDYMLEVSPDAREVLYQGFAGVERDSAKSALPSPEHLEQLFSNVLRAKDPGKIVVNGTADKPGAGAGLRLTLYMLPECPPHKLLTMFMKEKRDDTIRSPSSRPALHSLIGYVQIEAGA